jgi:hypothetical protein
MDPAVRVLAAAVNAGGAILARVAGDVPRLGAGTLVRRACRSTGLEDFGPGDFTEALERLVTSLENEAALTEIGRLAARWDLGRLLATRLRLEDERRRWPEIAQQEIRRPIFVTGLPRTGTTILHALLAQDPAVRAPLHWECLFPTVADGAEQERRIRLCARNLAWFHVLNPAMRRIHPLGALLPEECLILTSYSLLSFQFETSHRVPSYQAWLEAMDLRPMYQRHRRLLQHLQFQRPGERWVLKAPAHLFGIDAIRAVYPDAGIVFTHRDPLEVVASNASLHTVLRRSFSDRVDPPAVARENTVRWCEGMRRALAARDDDHANAASYVDVFYRDLVGDPLAVVGAIYDRLGFPLTAAAERAMRDFLRRNPRDRYGRHEYGLAEFGLDPAEEECRYRSYRERFGV